MVPTKGVRVISDISDLFAKEPPFTVEERARVIAKYRENRAAWNSGTKPAKAAKPKGETKTLSLDDIGDL